MRHTVLVDRTLTLLVGVLGVACAAAVWAWREGMLLSEDTLDLSWLRRQLATEWWPWTMGIAGGVLVVLGLTLAVVHLPRRRVSVVGLRGSDARGTAVVESEVLVGSVANRIREIEGVRMVRGRIVRERRQLVMSLVVVVDPTVSLRRTVTEVEEAAGVGALVAQRDDLAFRCDLRVARREQRL